VERYQQFPNALTHFTDINDMRFRPQTYRPRVLPPDTGGTEWEKMHEKSIGPRAAVPNDYFLHCYFESAANIMAGVNEMLLQSHDGVIRVFPAVEENFTGLFTLCATAGFKVSSEMSEGEIRYVHIKSGFSRVCKIELPWPDIPVSVTGGSHSGESVSFALNENILSFDAVEGGEYLITRCEYPLDCYYREDVAWDENTLPKEWRANTIGRFSFTRGRANNEKYTIFQEDG
jgi:hypothetical protein